MKMLYPTTELDREMLVSQIVEQFRSVDKLNYKRVLLEFFDEKGQFIGDNLFETTFQIRANKAPLIYEVSGPFDIVSKQYATIAKIYHSGELLFQCDLKAGIFQRTAAMVWIFLDVLARPIGKILLIGAGKVGLEIGKYLKHFVPNLFQLDYQDYEPKTENFETPLNNIGLQTNFQETPDLSDYDTIIMATTTNTHLVNNDNISSLKKGAVIISLCTTSQSGEIAPEIFGRDDVNIFIDYELTKSFTGDMKYVNKLGHLDQATRYDELLNGKTVSGLDKKINIVRLTGTPMQNIAVVEVVLNREKLKF
jgi:ornithine cyclodeaminase/alanine dehydrogenase-like protein (mu-crystallin family)